MSAYNNLRDYDRLAASMKAQPALANAVPSEQPGELLGAHRNDLHNPGLRGSIIVLVMPFTLL
ncbi:MAG: hypothetical protein ACR2OV_12670 [Hyphomicrobiaceae bacterium]